MGEVMIQLLALVAHHSFSAEFDAAREVRLVGEVVKVEWTNPHAAIYLDAKDARGEVVHWMVETASPNALARRGFNRGALAVGMTVVIEGNPAKSGEHRVSGLDIILPDGRKVLLRSDGSGSP
jgi:hypothetical protein